MCGRVALFEDQEFLAEASHYFHGIAQPYTIMPSYNIAPSQPIAILSHEKVYTTAHFGLIPHWAKDAKHQPVNARAETLLEKPTFRDPYQNNRCLIPINGFFEWKRVGREKIPYWIYPTKANFFALAGVSDTWYDLKSGQKIRSCAIITTTPNTTMAPIHHRMPVIVQPEDWTLWLNRDFKKGEALDRILKPSEPRLMDMHEVSTFVNTPVNNSKQCIHAMQNTLF